MVLRSNRTPVRGRNSEGPQRSARIAAPDHSFAGRSNEAAAPAEGVHGDEISHEAASPKFEAVRIFAIAAVLVPIAHLAAPLFCCR